MKAGMFYCASQASTATANGERTVTARAIDRHNPIIKDGRRSFTAPCSSGDDYVAPYRQLSKITRVPSSSGDGKSVQVDKGRRSNSGSLMKLISYDVSLARKSFGCVVATPKTPPGSTRYLLGSDPVSLAGSTGQDTVATEESEASAPKRGSSGPVEEKKKSSGSGSDQVVVLRVSLHCHCRGCQGKVKKHLSKMQVGVTSFNIDFASKKVTVTGDITPLEVLGCLSKVKNAQFWTPPPPSIPRANPET
ncbi:Chloroplast-targeted copper chaperone protein [Arabidopsis thaliana]|uniref:Isoform 2 of Protein SODIUM POTASSIUM ROOT DEFECTIVE 3 n=1 Tax=Arabidopsis thaliana TaxID=3702 RepID=Q8RXH8-2|nr:Chloroplast-targeted copper chaperone protein [Arabidopsis thaliana]AEE79105.1 Chloroplast-targeted copper chaperone protein [Arabidopsis thaliana]|eukprot:NP_001030852.1 Chloroplast-targeted copper chaperone protein [Arabidopsis thaliana]